MPVSRRLFCAAANRALYDKAGRVPQGGGGVFTMLSQFSGLAPVFALVS
jgi:hypothetical protein